MKKIVALVLALALVLASCVVAFAADPTYKITVTNANKNISIAGREFKAYKIFDATFQTVTKDDGTTETYIAYFIKKNSYYYTNDAARTELEKYFTFETDTTDSTRLNAKIKATNNQLSSENAFALANKLTGLVPTGANAHDAKATGSGNPATAVLDVSTSGAGYYLVTGSVESTKTDEETDTAVALVNVIDENARIQAKADLPPLEKKISAVSTGALDDAGKRATEMVGQSMTQELYSNIPDLTGYDDFRYRFYDNMGKGLTYNQDAIVIIGEGTSAYELDINKYSFVEKDANHFILDVPYATWLSLQNIKGTKVTVRYTVTINKDALTYDYAKNTAYLEYGKDPGSGEYPHTPEDETYEIDVNVDVNKYTGTDATTGEKVPGAEFKLFKGAAKTADQTADIFYQWDDTNKKVLWVSKEASDTIKTASNGKLEEQFKGLAQGTYCLLETKAPDGFNGLKDPVEFTVTVNFDGTDKKKVTITSTEGTVTGGNNGNNGTIDLSKAHTDNPDQPVVTIDVLNNHGTELPSTGGIGTTIFYILGGVLVIGAAVILIARRKAQD